MSFVDELLSRHRQLNGEVEKESAKAQDLMVSIGKKRRAIEALEELIRIEGGTLPQDAPLLAFPVPARVGTPITETAYVVLEERAHPMHYHELTREVQMRGMAVGGRNPANTLLAHLSRDDRFYRPGRGTYGLREWDPKARSVGVRRKKGA